MNNLVYEDTAKYDFWLKFILGGVLALTFIVGVVLISEDAGAALVMFGVTLFDALLFKAILPKRFQVLEDRLRIVLGGPFAINIPFSSIEDVRSLSGARAFAYWGLKFATSIHCVVEIVRKKGLSLIISPTNEDMFIEQLNKARMALSS
jgi:hypothetical protein